jgi:hypothetical protein
MSALGQKRTFRDARVLSAHSNAAMAVQIIIKGAGGRKMFGMIEIENRRTVFAP